MPTKPSVALLLASALVLSVVVQPVAGLAGVLSPAGPDALQQADGGENVSVGVGQQLSTVITATSVRTGSAVSADLFDQAFENATEEEKAEAIATRAETIQTKAVTLQGAFDNATAAYRDGDLATSDYAQRLATFNARASVLDESATVVMDRAENVSTLELQAAGYNESDLKGAVDAVESLTSVGLATIYQQFTGEVESNVSISATDGLSVTTEDDGEFAREFEREGDDETTYSVSQAAALDTARGTLTPQTNGTWTLVDANVEYEYGTYRFEFDFSGQEHSGEAEATIDGSSGDVIRFEEEIEREDEDGMDDPEVEKDGDDEDDEQESEDVDEEDEGDEHETEGEDDEDEHESEYADDEDELVLLVTNGTIAPSETVTLQALRNATGVSNVTIEVNDEIVGETDENGTITVTLPDHETEIEGGEASLSFEFDNEERDTREIYQQLTTDAEISDGTMTVVVEYDNRSVSNATVWVNDENIGKTAASGTIAFDVGNESAIEVEIVKGEFEAELEFERVNGTFILTKQAHEGDGDKVRSENEADEDEADEEAEENEADDDQDEEDEEDEEDGEDGKDDESSEDSDDSDEDDDEDDRDAEDGEEVDSETELDDDSDDS